MESDKQTLEQKCESLMNTVVQSRKQYGKKCVEYNEKKSLVENMMLKNQLKIIGNHRFKPKNYTSDIDFEEMEKDLDNFTSEFLETQNRVNILKKNVRDAQAIVLQLKEDRIGKKLHMQITADALLAEAKSKINK